MVRTSAHFGKGMGFSCVTSHTPVVVPKDGSEGVLHIRAKRRYFFPDLSNSPAARLQTYTKKKKKDVNHLLHRVDMKNTTGKTRRKRFPK